MARNKRILITLQAKIYITLLLWALPLLLTPEFLAKKMGLILAQPTLLGRLLGCAYLALSLGYWAGYRQIKSGGDGSWVFTMGLVSNGSATLFLIYSLVFTSEVSHYPVMQAYLIVSAIATGAITLALFMFKPKTKIV